MASSNLSGSNEITRDWVEFIPLHRAILKDDWDTTHEIISKDKDAMTFQFASGNTTLHLAVELLENIKFLDNLLKVIDPESLPSIVTKSKRNPLHSAAVVGNTEAAKMLVEKNPHLLFSLDGDEALPIHRAVYNSHQTTYLYLVDACKQYISLSDRDGYHSPFEGTCGARLVGNLIFKGFLDEAYELISDYPHMAVLKIAGDAAPLKRIAARRDAYLSGTRYNLYQRFVYSRLYLHSLC